MKFFQLFYASLLLTLTFYCLGQRTQTNNCFSCFTSEAQTSNVYYCNYAGTGYCCGMNTANDQYCIDKFSKCSKSLQTKKLSYTYCNRNPNCNSTSSTLNATVSTLTVRGTAARYDSGQICYYKLTSNNSDNNVADMYRFNLNFIFAANVRLFTGVSLEYAANQTDITMGTTYSFPVLDNGALNSIWIYVLPDNQGTYNPDFQFQYSMYRIDTSVNATLNLGIEPWQVGMIGVCLCIMAMAITCVIVKFVCKLGVPKYKPWEPNKKFYLKDEVES